MFHRFMHRHGGLRFARGDFQSPGRGGRERGEHDGMAGRGHDGIGGRRHHGPGGRGERLGRFFAHGDLRLVILSLIAEQPRHGYEIIKEIEDRVGGAYTPSPGVIYPTLTWLGELGYAEVAEAEGGKRLHSITEAGRAYMEANRATLDTILTRIGEAGRARADGPSPQVVRAIENLKLALRLRFARGPFAPEEAQRVAEALDAAAVMIERG